MPMNEAPIPSLHLLQRCWPQAAMWPMQRRIRRRRGLQSALLYHRGVEDAGIAGADFSFSGADPISRSTQHGTWGIASQFVRAKLDGPVSGERPRHVVAR